MAINAAVLQAGVVLTASAASIYTTPAAGQAVIKRAVFTNTSANPVTITVHRVPSAGSAAIGNKIIAEMRLTPGQAYVSPELSNMALNGGDSIVALCSAASSVNAFMSGFTL